MAAPVYIYQLGGDNMGIYTIAIQRNNSIQIHGNNLNIVLTIDDNIEFEELDNDIDHGAYRIFGRFLGNNIRNILEIQKDEDTAHIVYQLEIGGEIQDGVVVNIVDRYVVETLQIIAIALSNGGPMPEGHLPLAGQGNQNPPLQENQPQLVNQPVVQENQQPINQIVEPNNNMNIIPENNQGGGRRKTRKRQQKKKGTRKGLKK
jgi:hypothetical protein